MNTKENCNIKKAGEQWAKMFEYLISVAKNPQKQKALEYILDKRDINQKDPFFGNTFLIQAVVENDICLVNLILSLKKVDITLTGNGGYDALTVGVINKANIEILQALVNHGANINNLCSYEQNKIKISLLIVALKQENDAAFRFLLSQNADPNLYDPAGPVVPLYYFAYYQQINELKLLLQHGVNTNIVDSDGQTALHLLFGQPLSDYTVTYLKLLLQHGASLNIKCKNGLTPPELFISTHANQDSANNNNNLSDSKTKAITEKILKIFLKNGVNPSASCEKGYNLVTLAICKQQNYILEILLQYKDAMLTADEILTPLSAAIRYKNDKACDILLKAFQVQYPKTDVSEYINQIGVQPFNSTKAEKPMTIKESTDFSQQIMARQTTGSALIYFLNETKFDFEFLKLLCNFWLDNSINEEEIKNWIITNSNINKKNFIKKLQVIMKYLVNLRGDPPTPMKDETTVDITQVDKIKNSIIEAILSANIVDKQLPSLTIPDGMHFFYLINDQDKKSHEAHNYLSNIFDLSEKSDIQFNPLDLYEFSFYSPLVTAIQYNQNKVEYLLDKGANISLIYPEFQTNILHSCALHNAEYALQKIFSSKSINLVVELLLSGDGQGCTPLHYAAKGGHGQIIRSMIDYLRKVQPSSVGDFINRQEKKFGDTAIILATQNGHAKVVKLLLDNGADPDIPQYNNITNLYWAIYHAHSESLKVLLTHYKQRGSISKEFDIILTRINNIIAIKVCNLPSLTSHDNNNNNQTDFGDSFSGETTTKEKETGFSFIARHFGRETAKQLCNHQVKNEITTAVIQKENLHVDAIASSFNNLLNSTMPEVKSIESNNKTPNCKFFLDIVSLAMAKVHPNTILKYVNLPIFFASSHADQGLVKLVLQNIPKQKKEVTFFINRDDGSTQQFIGKVSHELKILQSPERIIVAKVKGDNLGTFYIGFEWLNHGLHTTQQKSSFFSSSKKITFYSPATELYKKTIEDLQSYQSSPHV